jgi:hypothetical protein
MSEIEHRNLPSATEFARALGGRLCRDGCVAFPGPGRDPRDRSCTLKFGGPDGVTVADARGKIPWQVLKDYVRDRVPGFGPFKPDYRYRRRRGAHDHD